MLLGITIPVSKQGGTYVLDGLYREKPCCWFFFLNLPYGGSTLGKTQEEMHDLLPLLFFISLFFIHLFDANVLMIASFQEKPAENRIKGRGKAYLLILTRLGMISATYGWFFLLHEVFIQHNLITWTRCGNVSSACFDCVMETSVLVVSFQGHLLPGGACHWGSESLTFVTRQQPLWSIPGLYCRSVSLHPQSPKITLPCQLHGFSRALLHWRKLE